MKRTLLLAALFLVCGAGAWYAIKHKNQASSVSWDKDFAIKDADEIGKIFYADRTGQKVTLERTKNGWVYDGQYKVRPSAIQMILETLTRINVWYVPTRAAEDAMVRTLAGEGIKVEIYDKKGNKMKSYYIGGVTNDERGTFVMMENAEQPYVAHIPSFVGQLRVRFLFGDEQLRDRTVFAEKAEDIQSVTVEYPQQKSESFKLEKTGHAEYKVSPYFSTTTLNPTPQHKGSAEAYLLEFEHKEAEAFETSNPLRDSVTALVPFVIVTMKNEKGEEQKARFWPVEIELTQNGNSPFVTRYFTDVNGRDFMLTQHQLFEPMFRGYNYFFDNSHKKSLPR